MAHFNREIQISPKIRQLQKMVGTKIVEDNEDYLSVLMKIFTFRSIFKIIWRSR